MKKLFAVSLLLAMAALSAFGQLNTMYSTTLSSAVTATDNVINVTSATNMVAPGTGSSSAPTGSQLYVVAPGNPRGETMFVRSISSTAITVTRGRTGIRSGFPSGSLVLFGPPTWFKDYDPSGSCTAANTFVTPWVNVLTGAQWLCSTITLSWVPGWQNPLPPGATAAVASVAGATAINGPLQHITGTNAITSFTMGVGWNGSGFCVIPDAAFTTTATNNILKASTAVAAKTLCWAYDNTNAGFTPSY